MGPEAPKQAYRRYTSGFQSLKAFPIRSQPRKSISSTQAGASSVKIPKAALTPISRLKKFQKLRDRNLRKEVLYKNNIRKHLTMLDSVETQPGETAKSPQELKELIKMENGEKEIENGINGENGLNGIEEEHEENGENGVGEEKVEENGVEENGEVRRSPRRSRGKEVGARERIGENSQDKQVQEIEVDVQVVESPSPSRRKSTPRKTPEMRTEEIDESPPYELNLLYDTTRISGRRPIREQTPPRKRKSDDMEEPMSKRMALGTPSVPSPGWRFLSPFSLFKKTPRAMTSRPVDDSLYVNVSTDSQDDLEATELDQTVDETPDTPQSPNKSTSWLCRIM